MVDSDRRKFLRVLFEAHFEVQTPEWSDKEATGLDISLNGCRFNCKQSMTDGDVISIVFKPGLEIEGVVKWCWPIEWYFQAALHFKDIVQEKQNRLKAYIEEVKGEDYKMQRDEATSNSDTEESVDIFEEDLDGVDNNLSTSFNKVEAQEDLSENSNGDLTLEELTPLEEEDLLNLDIEESVDSGSNFSEVEVNQEEFPENINGDVASENLTLLEEEDLLKFNNEDATKNFSKFSNTKHEDVLKELDAGGINTLSFAGQQVALFDLEEDQADLLNQYLSERAGIKVEYVTKKENLWRLLKIDPMDLVIIETGSTGNSDALEVMQETKEQFSEVNFICISGPVSLERRLQFLNAGSLDYLTRPVHLSTIAQSVLVHLSHTLDRDIVENISLQGEMSAANRELQEELASMKEQRDEAMADAKSIAKERDEAKFETKELEQKAPNLADEKETVDMDETFNPDSEPINVSSQIDSVEDLNEPLGLLEEDLTISGEIDLIEEDY